MAGYLLFSAGGNLLESHRLAENEDQLRAQVDALHLQETQLEQVRDYLRSDEYIEFMARRVFGFVKPGEALVIVQAPPSKPADDSGPPPGQPWWQQLFGR
jgi:cell division protein FtsB